MTCKSKFATLVLLIMIVFIGRNLWGFQGVPRAEILSRMPEDVKDQIEKLQAFCPLERMEALRVLSEIGKESDNVVDILINVLEHENDEVRQQAAFLLGVMKNPRAVEALVVALGDESLLVRLFAKSALGSVGESAVKRLISIIENESKGRDVRYMAARALREIKDERAVEPLILALGSNEEMTRHSAAIALGAMKEATALKPLIKVLNDESENVRYSAIIALGRIEDKRAVEPLILILQNHDEKTEVRCIAAEQLGKLGYGAAVPPLITALEDESVLLRARAARALGYIGDSRAIGPLKSLLEDGDENVRQAAASSLQKLTGERFGRRSEHVDSGDAFKVVEYSEKGVVERVRNYSKKTGKIHGEWREYGSDGELISSRWFVHGEKADEEAFLQSKRDEEKLKVERESQYSELEREEGERIDRFIRNLLNAWADQDYEQCRKLIDESLDKNSQWIPGLLARHAYMFEVERDFENSLDVLKHAWDLIKRDLDLEEGGQQITDAQRRLMIIPSTILILTSEIEKGTLEERKPSSSRLFSGAALIAVYSGVTGYRVSPIRELMPGN